jgi:hypothetical protein
MAMADAPALDIDRSLVGTLELEGMDAQYVNLEGYAAIPTHLNIGGIEYAYERTFPVRGHSAVLPQAITEYQNAGKRVVVAERLERYMVYLA